MAHILMIHAEKCTGCHNCALACSIEDWAEPCRGDAAR